MRTVTKENLIAQIDRLRKIKDEQGQLSMSGEYTLQAYEMLLATMGIEPVAATGNGLNVALSLTQMQIDWICNTCASIYNTRNDDVAQGYIDEIRATLERLAAMGSRPHTDDELSNLLWYSQEATCHSDPNYYCEFQRLATPGLIAGIIRELQERRKADSEPVAEVLSNRPGNDTSTIDRALPVGTQLYRHAQPAPVVPDEVTAEDCPALVKYDVTEVDEAWARGFNACRAAMLNQK